MRKENTTAENETCRRKTGISVNEKREGARLKYMSAWALNPGDSHGNKKGTCFETIDARKRGKYCQKTAVPWRAVPSR